MGNPNTQRAEDGAFSGELVPVAPNENQIALAGLFLAAGFKNVDVPSSQDTIALTRGRHDAIRIYWSEQFGLYVAVLGIAGTEFEDIIKSSGRFVLGQMFQQGSQGSYYQVFRQ